MQLTDDALFGGDEGQGLRQALATLTLGRIGIAAAGVGMAQAAFDHAVEHLSTREAFGRKLAANQHWQFLLADRATEIENARTLYLKAALRRDAGEIFPEPEAAMARHYGTRLSVDMARDAVQAFGGLGFARELSADSTRGRSRRSTATARSARSTRARTRSRSGSSPAASSARRSPDERNIGTATSVAETGGEGRSDGLDFA